MVARSCISPKGAPSERMEHAIARSAFMNARRMCSTLDLPCTKEITVRQPAACEIAVATAVPVTPQCKP